MSNLTALLDIATLAINHTFQSRVELHRDDSFVGFVLDMDPPKGIRIPYPTLHLCFSIEGFPHEQGVKISGTLNNYCFAKWDGMAEFFRSLQSELVLYFEGYYECRGGLDAFIFDEGLVAGYKTEISYEALTDLELAKEMEKALIVALRVNCFLAPIMMYMLEHRAAPDMPDRLRLLAQAYGMWEVENRLSDAPKQAVRLPSQLYGGIRTLRAQ